VGTPIWDPRKVLEVPAIYNFFQKMVGAQQGRLEFIQQIITPMVKSRILEVGCGTGINSEAFPKNISFVGCDISQSYIDHAKQHYGDHAEFYATPVGKLRELQLEPFDVVIALAVLHHLSDEDIINLGDEVAELLTPGGLFVTADPCFSVDQPSFSNFIASCDRGQHVRYAEEYSKLLEKRFSKVSIAIQKGKLLFIPCSGIIMVASME
jgi:2-polyprenyl-3-methyl-5-hydroxy-6-metoxy-1,4-benzoquinol methylase